MKKGYLLIIVSAMLFGTMPLFAKNIYALGGNALSLVFYRTVLAVVPFFVLAKYVAKVPIALKKKEWPTLLLLVAGFVLTPLLLYESYYYIPSGAATTLHFSYPLFITLIAGIILRKGVSAVEKICTALVTVGMLLMLDLEVLTSAKGSSLALLSGLTYAVYTVVLGEGNLRDMNLFKLGFYLMFFSSLIVGTIGLATDRLVWQLPFQAWIILIAFSLVITFGAVIMYQVGVGHIGAKKAGLLSTLEPIVSIFIGLLLMNEHLRRKEWIAITLILISTVMLVTWRREKVAEIK